MGPSPRSDASQFNLRGLARSIRTDCSAVTSTLSEVLFVPRSVSFPRLISVSTDDGSQHNPLPGRFQTEAPVGDDLSVTRELVTVADHFTRGSVSTHEASEVYVPPGRKHTHTDSADDWSKTLAGRATHGVRTIGALCN
ncbi:hypothetical protein BaRGS_00027112 [Batillaria attramentaria]|uniref:Uncharacterized protein n=1 Tax=Batillaria attramentaria TaxID=370345 RepID=A0ABD0K2R4_9CAEN